MRNVSPKHPLVKRTLAQVQRLVPWANNVQVRLKAGQKGIYEASVSVMKRGKVYFAKKQASNALTSLERATKAVVKQVQRSGPKKANTRPLPFVTPTTNLV